MNWKDRIERAKDTGRFTVDDLSCAFNWSSCAVGEIIDPYKRLTNKQIQLGFKFFTNILDNDIPQAEKTYKEIQRLKL